MSSILSTSSCGEGTQTTSWPDGPTSGVNSALGACAKAQTAIAEKIGIDRNRLAQRSTDISLLQMVGTERQAGEHLLGLAAGEMMARPRLPRQPLHEAGRNCAGTSVPSAGEPQRQLLTTLPPPDGRLPVLSSGTRVRSWALMRPSRSEEHTSELQSR